MVCLLALPHHDGSPLYVHHQQPPLGGEVGVRLRVPHGYDADRVVVRALRDTEPSLTHAGVELRDGVDAWWAADLTVHTPVTSHRFLLIGETGSHAWLNGSGLHRRDVTDAHDFRVCSYWPTIFAGDEICLSGVNGEHSPHTVPLA